MHQHKRTTSPLTVLEILKQLGLFDADRHDDSMIHMEWCAHPVEADGSDEIELTVPSVGGELYLVAAPKGKDGEINKAEAKLLCRRRMRPQPESHHAWAGPRPNGDITLQAIFVSRLGQIAMSNLLAVDPSCHKSLS